MSGTILVGYDVEAGAIGDVLARTRLDALAPANDPAVGRRGLEIIAANHRDLGLPATLFLCGRTMLFNLDAVAELAGDSLFDLQQHTYSHAPFRPDEFAGTTFGAAPIDLIRHEVAATSQLLAEHFGVANVGLRAPHGYHRGLTGEDRILDVLSAAGIEYVSSWGRNAAGGNPTPLEVQPFFYGNGLLELPYQHWRDGFWFLANDTDRGDGYGDVLMEAVDHVAEHDLVYGTCFHDWSMVVFDEPRYRWVRRFLDYAVASGVEVTSYTAYARRATAAAAVSRP